MDEDTALKAAGCKSFGGSIPSASALDVCLSGLGAGLQNRAMLVQIQLHPQRKQRVSPYVGYGELNLNLCE
jgi:hypothetical protein